MIKAQMHIRSAAQDRCVSAVTGSKEPDNEALLKIFVTSSVRLMGFKGSDLGPRNDNSSAFKISRSVFHIIASVFLFSALPFTSDVSTFWWQMK